MLQCILNVLLRERDIMSSRPIYLYGTILVLSFCAIFFVSLMYQGLPQRVPVGVVDMSRWESRRWQAELCELVLS